MSQKLKHNLRRFALHTAFGFAAMLALFVADNAADLGVPPEAQVLVITAATAAGSFFRGQQDETDE